MKSAFKMLGVFTILFGGIYPLFLTLIAQWSFPFQAQGSLLKYDEKIVGSLWLGQYFDHPAYFWGRPSPRFFQDDLLEENDISWLGDVKWKNLAREQQQKFNRATLPIELQSMSASAVDPHVSPQAINIQLERVAQARHIPIADLRQWVASFIENPIIGIWGTPRVNVLRLNLAMDHKWGQP